MAVAYCPPFVRIRLAIRTYRLVLGNELMEVHFLSDLSIELKQILEKLGLSVPTSEELREYDKRPNELKDKIKNYDLNNLLLHFFTVNSRRVPIISWNVHISDKLSGRQEIIEIVNKLSNGDDVNNLTSKYVRKKNQSKYHYADLLRYEWGIYHLHFDKNGTDDLLFIYLKDGNAYLIDILPHEKRDNSVVTWTNTDLIQTMHDNWPELIRPFIFNTDGLHDHHLTVEQRRTLRAKGAIANVIVSDGTEYIPLGGGFSSSLHPIDAIFQTDMLIHSVGQLQLAVENNHAEIEKLLLKYTHTPILKLKLDSNFNPCVVETSHNILLNFQDSQD